MLRTYSLCVLVLLLATAAGAAEKGKTSAPPERWIFCPTNLLVDENIDKLAELFRRGHQRGYTHAFLADSKFGHLDDLPNRDHYFQNLQRTRKLAADFKLEIVPAVFPIGWSNDILWHDPNLAEGLPVRDALFVVQGGEARLVADPPIKLRAGDMADINKWHWHDPCVTLDDGAARITDPQGIGRLVQSVEVAPFRQYHISLRIKTKDFQGTPEVKVLAETKGDLVALAYDRLGVPPTQDWATYHVVFNSLEQKKVLLYLGCWDGRKGSLWFDDVAMEEVGLVNLLRRPGAPLVVKRESDGKALTEGSEFEPVVDKRLGNAKWPGDFDAWHAPPTIHTALADGTRLRVSYFHPMLIEGGSVMIALSEPKTLEVLRKQARTMHDAWHAAGYFMQFDEIRILNWDQASQDRKLDAGQVLAASAQACTKILDEVNPGGRIYVWSDMFDPFHNAHDNYYLVRGNLAGSWDGLDPKVIVANWNYEKRDESLKFFADRGHKQIIAGYYDAPVGNLRNWLDAAAKVKGVEGVMYTTWVNNYADLEAFAKEAEK